MANHGVFLILPLAFLGTQPYTKKQSTKTFGRPLKGYGSGLVQSRPFGTACAQVIDHIENYTPVFTHAGTELNLTYPSQAVPELDRASQAAVFICLIMYKATKHFIFREANHIQRGTHKRQRQRESNREPFASKPVSETTRPQQRRGIGQQRVSDRCTGGTPRQRISESCPGGTGRQRLSETCPGGTLQQRMSKTWHD